MTDRYIVTSRSSDTASRIGRLLSAMHGILDDQDGLAGTMADDVDRVMRSIKDGLLRDGWSIVHHRNGFVRVHPPVTDSPGGRDGE